jgi:hypothetical protein
LVRDHADVTCGQQLQNVSPGLIINVHATKQVSTVMRLCSEDLAPPPNYGWISATVEDHTVAVKVRNNRGWDAICMALGASNIEIFSADNIGLGTAGSESFAAVVEEESPSLKQVKMQNNTLLGEKQLDQIRAAGSRGRGMPVQFWFSHK